MTTNGRHNGSMPNVAGSVSDLTHDVIELTELQAQLLALDVRQTAEQSKLSLILGVVGVSTLLGTIPVGLIALAATLVQALEWSVAVATAVAALIGLLLAAAILAAAWAYFKNGLHTLQRSRDELKRNIAWLKSTLRARGKRDAAARQPLNL